MWLKDIYCIISQRALIDASIPIVGRANVCEQEAVELRTVALKAGCWNNGLCLAF
jgi:hypothetical protein